MSIVRRFSNFVTLQEQLEHDTRASTTALLPQITTILGRYLFYFLQLLSVRGDARSAGVQTNSNSALCVCGTARERVFEPCEHQLQREVRLVSAS